MSQSEELDNKIIVMWNAKMISSEIATALNVTRSVVMGRIFRLRKKGVYLRSPDKKKLTPITKREVKTRKGWVLKSTPKVKTAPNISLEQPFFNIPEPSATISIMDLTNKSCRYIIDSDRRRGAIYCGSPKQYKSYCKAHADLCYVPLRSSV